MLSFKCVSTLTSTITHIESCVNELNDEINEINKLKSNSTLICLSNEDLRYYLVKLEEISSSNKNVLLLYREVLMKLQKLLD